MSYTVIIINCQIGSKKSLKIILIVEELLEIVLKKELGKIKKDPN